MTTFIALALPQPRVKFTPTTVLVTMNEIKSLTLIPSLPLLFLTLSSEEDDELELVRDRGA